jgi:hypothetical protein
MLHRVIEDDRREELERFVTSGSEPGSVRADIAASWERGKLAWAATPVVPAANGRLENGLPLA